MKKEAGSKIHRALQYTLGYINLGMPEEAVRELSLLAKEQQLLPEVMSLKAQAYLILFDWVHAASVARNGHELYPEIADFYVQQALAYEQLGEAELAISWWESSPDEIRNSGFCHYNIARCEARLGRLTLAREHMKQALKLEPKLIKQLQEDPFYRILPAMPAALS